MLKNNNSIAFVLDLVPMARYTWHLMTFTPTCVFDIKPDCALMGFDRASSAIFVRFWWSYYKTAVLKWQSSTHKVKTLPNGVRK